MKKTVIETREITIDKYYCDCCNKQIKNYNRNNIYNCSICGNMMCNDCSSEMPIYNDQTLWTEAYNDPYFICKECKKIIPPYAEKLNNLWIQYLDEKHKTINEVKKLRGIKQRNL